jgi:hypothetical protein
MKSSPLPVDDGAIAAPTSVAINTPLTIRQLTKRQRRQACFDQDSLIASISCAADRLIRQKKGPVQQESNRPEAVTGARLAARP